MHDLAADLDAVEQAYERGRYLDAFELLRAAGGLDAQRETRGLVLGGRIASNLGARRLGRWLTVRAHRRDPRDAQTAFYFADALTESRGVLSALRFLERFQPPADADAEDRALLLLSRSMLLSVLRDFESATALWAEAAGIWEHPWLWVEKAAGLLHADRVDDAHRAAEMALGVNPSYRPALQQMAQVLVLQDRRGEAAALLAAQAGALQAPYLWLQLAQIRSDLEDTPAALQALLAAVALLPIPEHETVQQLSALASDLHFKLENVDAAAMFAELAGSPAHLRLAERLRQARPARRVLLDVPFVRQDHKTCAPATLTSLCQYHRRAADHVAIVEQICYDGTPAASERRWAEEHGFAARHFTVTWDAAVALLDRGLPFALLTVAADSAHLQAVIGYDQRRASFLVRDPSVAGIVEMDAGGLLANQAFAGPQGLVLIPAERAAELDAVALPDSALHDGLYRLQRALLAHDRDLATRELAALEAAAPDSVAAAQAQRALAAYDDNAAAMLVALDRLLAIQRDAAMPLLVKLSCLSGLAREDERRQQLYEAASRQDADPVFGRLWAQELTGDARAAPLAELWLGFAVRRRPQDGAAYALLAQVASLRGDLATACKLQRLAACLDEMNEWAAAQYFRLARALGQREAALAFLRARTDRLGRRSFAPWQTLFEALQSLDRAREAHDLLQAARAARPDDGDLGLFTVNVALRQGRIAEARALLETARGRVKETAWRYAAAMLERAAGARAAALDHLQTILRIDPLSLDAHAAVAQLLVETAGREAACAHLHAAVAAHPHHARLARLLVDFTPDEGEEGLRVVQRLVDLAPTDAWARRELAVRLARRQRPDEAWRQVEEAALLEPDAAATHGARGIVHAARGERDQARDCYRQALTRSADYVFAFNALVGLADDLADRLRAIRWLQQELRRQVVFGEGLAGLRAAAHGLLPDDEIVDFLEEARRARPDLLGCWTAVIEQRMAMGQLDQARQVAEEAAANFPLVVEPLVALASIEERRGDQAARRAALDRCLQLEPHHALATRALADVLERTGDAPAARRLIERAIERSPVDIGHRAVLAMQHERAGELDAAFAAVRRLLEIDPDCDWAWNHLADWGQLHGAQDAALAVARAITEARPHAGPAHLGLARLLVDAAGRGDDALQAIDRAVACEPRSVDAHDLRAVLLTRLGRHDDALHACKPAVFGDSPPLPLRGRHAWVLAESGEHDRAIREMELAVGDHPDYGFGLATLAEWYERQRRLDEAQRCYQRLLKLDPGSTGAAFGLFDVCLARNDLDGCQRALAGIDARNESPFLLSRRVALLCAQRQPAQALALLRRMSLGPQSGAQPMLSAMQALARIGRRRAALKIVEAAMVTTGAEPSVHLGEAWAHLACGLSLPSMFLRLRRLLCGAPAAEAGVGAYLENLIERGDGLNFWILTALFWRRFRRFARVWGAVGFGLAKRGKHRLVVRWMRDHAGRADCRPWMLGNLALSLRTLGHDDAAGAISESALGLPPDHTSDMHHRWLAWDAARAGNVAVAEAHLQRALAVRGDLGKLVDAYTRALLLVARNEPPSADGGDPLTGARVQIDAAEAACGGIVRSRLGRRLAAAARARLG